MKEYNYHILIMAGGIGSRLWPMSTPECPKQFIDVLGVGRSLLQLTVDRFRNLCPIENFWLVTSEKYLDLIKEQLSDISESHILLEPEARNTAPCISLACWKIKKNHPKANIVVTPSDAVVLNVKEFQRIIQKALFFTEDNEAIVTIGIKPNRPETGYGYICSKDAYHRNDICRVDAFKEKPNLATAQKYLDEGCYLWNAGIFVWNVDTIVKSIRRFTPQIASIMDEMMGDFDTDKEKATIKRLFPTCEKISIDYAVMEKSSEIYTIPADFGWSDLGTWGSLNSVLSNNQQGNVVVGNNVKLVDCLNCIVHIDEKLDGIIQGLDGYIVAEKNQKLLICKLSEEQHIKEYLITK